MSTSNRASALRVAAGLALTLIIVAVTITSSTPTQAGPTTAPPAGYPEISPGHVPGHCSGDFNAYATSYGVYWSEFSHRWVQAPRCYPRWGYLEASASQVVEAGDVVTMSIHPDDGRMAGEIARQGGVSWSYPGTLVAGCGTTDVTCTVRIGTAGAAPAEWAWSEFRISAPGRVFILPVSYAPRCQVELPCLDTYTQAWTFVGVRPEWPDPTADFGADVAGGTITVHATTSDPADRPMTHHWSFEAGPVADGATVEHTYTSGTAVDVTLTSTTDDGRSDTITKTVELDLPFAELTIEPAANPIAPGATTTVAVTVRSLDADQPIDVSFAEQLVSRDGLIEVDPLGGASGQHSVPPAGLRTFTYTVTAGPDVGNDQFRAAITATNSGGKTRTIEATYDIDVSEKILDVVGAFDPDTITLEEDANGPQPQTLNLHVTVSNVTDQDVTSAVLLMLSPGFQYPGDGAMLASNIIALVEPEPDGGIPIGDVPAGATIEVDIPVTVMDDGLVEWGALAKFTHEGSEHIERMAPAKLESKPKLFFKFESKVVQPIAGSGLLPAGDPIGLSGTVKNLTNSATIDLGPLFPELRGNAGVMRLTYDTVGGDPRDLIVPDDLQLKPGETKDFSLRISTAWSDPRSNGGVAPSGGTRATMTFTPWGTATFADGTTQDVDPPQMLTTDDDLVRTVHIDDSIPIPEMSAEAYGGAILVGAVEGVWSLAVGTLYGVWELVKAPYTILVATAEFLSQVWQSFTDAEKKEFAADATQMAVSILVRSAELGRQNAGELWDTVNEAVLASMTEMAKDWEVGDVATVTETIAKYSSEAIGSVVLPTALAKLAKSPKAVAAVARGQEALNARMRPILDFIGELRTVRQYVDVLKKIAPGTELTLDQIAILYGISPSEVAELQRLATKYDFLLTVRSRHMSSIKWIEEFGAMLKPEALKLKSVSELDTRLGYRAEDVGQLVFRKPDAYVAWEQGGYEAVQQYLANRGFQQGTTDYNNALSRVLQRTDEWRKLEKTYKKYDAQGFIDTTFNLPGNGVSSNVATAVQDLRGFRLERIAGETESYVIKMKNDVGDWVPVTGDIDPIAFTHLDGSPLTEVEHALLLKDMQASPLLRAQHGESATFIKGGTGFIESQFSPGDPGLQFAPGGRPPRVAKFRADKSRWESPYDYHLHWEGGFAYAGAAVKVSDTLVALDYTAAAAQASRPAEPGKNRALPNGAGKAGPNVGRCRVIHSNDPGSRAAYMGSDGKIHEAAPDGSVGLSSLNELCFGDGAIIDVKVQPSTVAGGGDASGDTPGALTESVAGVSEIEVAADGSVSVPDVVNGFAVGQQIVVGAGTDHAEIRTITGFGSIIVDRPFQFDHLAGEVIVVVAQAEPVPVTTTTVLTQPTPVTVPSVTVAPTLPPVTVAPTLPRTGTDGWRMALWIGGLLILLGAIILTSTRTSRMGSPWDSISR